MIWAFAAFWVYVGLLMLEISAAPNKDGRFRWTWPVFFVVLVLVAWPVVVPIAIYFTRKRFKQGATK